jgi:hypothetical protein
MSTQVLGPERSKVMVALVALALALAVFLLASQATSLWSSSGGAQLQPAPVPVASVAGTHAVNGSQIPPGCRVKYGCHRGGPSTTNTGLATGAQIPDGCRVKFGC